jgi:thiamine-phosphate pyrophosphorylase
VKAPRPDIPIKGLYAIIDLSMINESEVAEKASMILSSGIRMLQLRAKTIGSGKVLQKALALRELTKEYNSLFIVNDRVDVARLSNADGVHLGQDDLKPEDAREILGGNAIIGVSTHNLREAVQAEKDSATYISFGPVYATMTKPDAQSPKGVHALSEVKKTVSCPVVAIGGIREENIGPVISAGADAVAMISEILSAEDIAAKVSSLVRLF